MTDSEIAFFHLMDFLLLRRVRISDHLITDIVLTTLYFKHDNETVLVGRKV